VKCGHGRERHYDEGDFHFHPEGQKEHDQTNDSAARQDEVKQPVVVTQQQAEQQAARPNPVVAGSQNATWDETSLIGKLFIAFGALLTVASAARMFMA